MPETITEEQYQTIRANKDADPVLAGFVGFGCSFGGKWFGGYARNKGGTNYAAQSKRSLLKDMATLGGAEIFCGDYKQVPIPPGAVVYADPPYDNTTGYNNEKFNSTEFWQAMRLLADTGHTVYISEQTAPPYSLLYQARHKVILWFLSRDPVPVLAGISGETEKHRL